MTSGKPKPKDGMSASEAWAAMKERAAAVSAKWQFRALSVEDQAKIDWHAKAQEHVAQTVRDWPKVKARGQ